MKKKTKHHQDFDTSMDRRAQRKAKDAMKKSRSLRNDDWDDLQMKPRKIKKDRCVS